MKFTLFSKIRPQFLFVCLLTACVSDTQNAVFDKQQAAKARVDLAIGYLNQQDLDQAKLNLDKALSYAPDYYLVHSALAYFYQKQGFVEQANQSYLTAIDLNENQGDVRNNYGVFLCGQGKFEQAYDQFQHALASTHYYHQADTFENIALCAYAQNNQTVYQENLAQLEKIAPERALQLKSAVK
ncbi:type IV pilus biogenesis/stability protein PilW [[Actinobacillus] rossii]|uniref:Type IV pilus biogenesis/stability protein PilW n=1 Tax=[Actinobacillus] rossii TaxID=123820 RepID=A0A380TNC0_9PAST|nr:type IV pilus biogenesis/stability protein PilW [[Actinobacillus] rossii]